MVVVCSQQLVYRTDPGRCVSLFASNPCRVLGNCTFMSQLLLDCTRVQTRGRMVRIAHFIKRLASASRCHPHNIAHLPDIPCLSPCACSGLFDSRASETCTRILWHRASGYGGGRRKGRGAGADREMAGARGAAAGRVVAVTGGGHGRGPAGRGSYASRSSCRSRRRRSSCSCCHATWPWPSAAP